ncbi:hypothetical protein Btru_060260 [Bulinus truncatus]|nr:hypothetical protein Btru_060260 [Bulinus truncatus]
MTSLPSCDFDKSVCTYSSHSNHSSLQWELANGASGGPLMNDWQPPETKSNGSYMFLNVSDPHIPINTTALISAELPTGVTPICIEFHYATTGDQKHDIRLYGQTDPGYGSRLSDELIGERKNINTDRQWCTANIVTCTNRVGKC